MEAARILKGVNLVSRVHIAGVPCLLLSQAPQPGVAAAIKRNERQRARAGSAGVIKEGDEAGETAGGGETATVQDGESEGSSEGSNCESGGESEGTKNLNNYAAKNVIFHLAGGGFFIHTTATDIPYLSEWSAMTDSIVVVPEYALLPEHHFPRG